MTAPAGDSPLGLGARAVCVLGMSRSGTSLTARILNLMGVDLGPSEDLLEPNRDNTTGFWEQRPIVLLNEEILVALGGWWFDPPPLEPGWERSPGLDGLRQRARALLLRQFGDRPLWGVKDPRLSVLLPFWRPLLPSPSSFVICVRDPREVAASLARRDPRAHPPEATVRAWLRHTTGALAHTEGAPRLVVSFEDYFRDGGRQVSALARFLGIELTAGVRDQIARFTRPELRHRAGPAGAQAVPLEATVMHACLTAVARWQASSSASALDETLGDALVQLGRSYEERQRVAVAIAEGIAALSARLEATLDHHAATVRHHEAALRRLDEEARARSEQHGRLLEVERRAHAERVAHLERRALALADEARRSGELVAQLLGSRSWRATSPLRAAGRRLRAIAPRAARR